MAHTSNERQIVAGGFVTLLIFLLSMTAMAHEAGETQAQVGPGQAVESYDEHDGLKLSAKALKTLNIKTIKMTVDANATVPKSALVNVKEDKSIYILRDGLFKFVTVKINSSDTENSKITTPDLKSGDEIVVSGAPLLRVAHINLIATGSEENHPDDHSDQHEGSHDDKHEDEHKHSDGDHHD